jgi:hypothetical protein
LFATFPALQASNNQERQDFVPDSGPSASRPGWQTKQLIPKVFCFVILDGGFGHRFFCGKDSLDGVRLHVNVTHLVAL